MSAMVCDFLLDSDEGSEAGIDACDGEAAAFALEASRKSEAATKRRPSAVTLRFERILMLCYIGSSTANRWLYGSEMGSVKLMVMGGKRRSDEDAGENGDSCR